MKTSKISSVASAMLVAAAVLLAPRPSFGQPMDLDTPVDSPLWWTLTDEITPAQLRVTYRDPKAQIERYRAALAAGLTSQRLREDQLRYIKFYYNTRMTPELTPMWLAFNAFAVGHLHFQGAAHATDALTQFGFGKTTIDTILLFGTRQFDESQAIVQEIGPKSLKFQEIEHEAIKARGGGPLAIAAVERAAKEGDLAMLQPDAGMTRTDLADLRAAWMRHPITETAAQLLPQLRRQLTGDAWQRLRQFLLEHVVASMGPDVMDTDSALGVTP